MQLVSKDRKIRYAIVGLGHIAQDAVIPAFKKAKRNSQLTTIISQHEEKLHYIGDKYKIKNRYLLSHLEDAFTSEDFDALYICTPNDSHGYITEKASQHGIHVICEKPQSIRYLEALEMIENVKKNNIKYMTAYRFHFHPAYKEIHRLLIQKKIGDLKIFQAQFNLNIKDISNFRLQSPDKGGGPLHDIGIYCINAARTFFKEEPLNVFAFSHSSRDIRFKDCDEMVSCILKFPHDKIASFTVSFGSYRSSEFDLIGTLGKLKLERAFEYSKPMTLKLYQDKKIISHKFFRLDQFASEILHFSDCILNNKKPLIPIDDGSQDLKVVEALLLSLDLSSPINLDEFNQTSIKTEIMKKPKLLLPMSKFFGTW